MQAPILVYGGTGGIGSALARRLVAAGRRVHLAARDEARLSALAGELGAGATVVDALDPPSLARAVAEAGPSLGGLAYCVGSITLKPVARLTDADLHRDFALNAAGAFHAVQAAVTTLKAGEGTPGIVLFSTVAVAQGFPSHASVSMAKAAVEGLTRALAAELAPRLRVNCLAPSLTVTPLSAGLTANPQMASAIAQMHPLPRLGEADDAAALAAFLLSPEAGWITGQVIGVDGGRATLRPKG